MTSRCDGEHEPVPDPLPHAILWLVREPFARDATVGGARRRGPATHRCARATIRANRSRPMVGGTPLAGLRGRTASVPAVRGPDADRRLDHAGLSDRLNPLAPPDPCSAQSHPRRLTAHRHSPRRAGGAAGRTICSTGIRLTPIDTPIRWSASGDHEKDPIQGHDECDDRSGYGSHLLGIALTLPNDQEDEADTRK